MKDQILSDKYTSISFYETFLLHMKKIKVSSFLEAAADL